MPRLTRRTALAGLIATPFLARSAHAQPFVYELDRAKSIVGFTYELSGVEQKGSMPVLSADISIDSQRLDTARVDVAVSAARARTALIFATDALKSPSVLDTDNHPEVRFVSRSIRLAQDGRLSGGAKMTGDLTMRGVTRPLSFDADVYRAAGSAPDDLSKLQVRLRGRLNRSAFGASGYANLVGDTVTLDIQTVITALT